MMKVVYNNPLDMWRNKAMKLPYLTHVARRVLSIPAPQAQSERKGFDCGTHCEQKLF